ncbi:MAG: hypothetical protein NWR72_03290 [Bacteroidia bacterium]|nr:hypothetical protein [Bacteroidia bacterium]
MHKCLLFAVFGSFALTLSAQTYQPLWSNFDANLYLPSNNANFAEQYDVTLDNSGNAYSVYKLGGTDQLGLVKLAPDGTCLFVRGNLQAPL